MAKQQFSKQNLELIQTNAQLGAQLRRTEAECERLMNQNVGLHAKLAELRTLAWTQQRRLAHQSTAQRHIASHATVSGRGGEESEGRSIYGLVNGRDRKSSTFMIHPTTLSGF
ncbi:hypothetical protein IWQ60_012076 [Tieghemiomyces parasiticus]|uniref:Uncharacterized protein n=1 Tax=Tieghemiomyces parasiticus TaxID=78921 RepID=A0A9W7ZFY4_9FUNG|nr:hypothetical protein IWQ60_012076 [Tieghemiomyces parasiticus]